MRRIRFTAALAARRPVCHTALHWNSRRTPLCCLRPALGQRLASSESAAAAAAAELVPGLRGQSLPVVDIAPFLADDAADAAGREHAARCLLEACRDVGFFYLVGHGVGEAEVLDMHRMARAFFEQPQAYKEEIAISRCPEGGRGYQRLGENVTKGRKDWHEAIDFYAEVAGDTDAVDLGRLTRKPGAATPEQLQRMQPFVLGRNQWPREPREFRATTEAHFERMARLGGALMDAACLALDLAPNHFRPLTNHSFWCARVIGYPPLRDAIQKDGEELEVGDSVGEHTDYGCWTILSQDDTPGALEVRLASGDWVAAQPVPGAFVVNLGDMLSVWTRRRFAATPHRVRQTQPGRYRTSIAFFYEPNFDAVIEPLDVDVDVDSPQALDPQFASTAPLERAMRGDGLVYGEHLFAKVDNNFAFAEDAR